MFSIEVTANIRILYSVDSKTNFYLFESYKEFTVWV